MGLLNLVCPDFETFQCVWAECGYDRDIRRVAASCDQHSSDPWHVVAGVEYVPSASNVNLDPCGEIRDRIRWRDSYVTQVARAIPCRNIHTATECDGQVCVVATNSYTLVVGVPRSSGRTC